MPRTTFLGLNMDVTMVPKIIAACRGLYPGLVSPTDSDDRVVQLVLHRVITEHLGAWAARQVVDPTVAAQAAADQALQTQQDADAAARADAADIDPTATT